MKRKLIRNINVYLNEKQEKVWNELPELYTNSQRIEHLINFYIVHNKENWNGNLFLDKFYIE